MTGLGDDSHLTNVIPLDRRLARTGPLRPPTPSIGAFRATTGMDANEFADALGEVLGWPVPVFVYLQWEAAGAGGAPADVLHAARRICLESPIGAAATNLSRRQFITGLVALSSLTTATAG